MDLPLDSFDLDPAIVRARFDTARRSGLPHWLWPDVPIADWQAALRSIGATIRDVMGGRTSVDIPSVDAAALGVACYTSGMGPLLGHWADRGLIVPPPPVAPLLALHLAHNRRRMAQLTASAGKVVDTLATAGIAVTVLKGMHTAYAYFPEPGARPVSDIDLIVRPVDASAVGYLLSALGLVGGKTSHWPPQQDWRPADAERMPRTLRLVHAQDPWSIDLQTSLSRRTAGGAREVRLEDVRAEFSHGRWPSDPHAAVLDQPLHLLHLAIHAGCGLESLSLLRLVELALVIRKDLATGALSWTAFVALGERIGGLGFAYAGLRTCDALIPGTVPATVLARCRQAAPPSVRTIVDRLDPCLAQRVERCSLGERYMWADSWWLMLRQFAHELVPPDVDTPAALYRTYATRFARLRRGTVTS